MNAVFDETRFSFKVEISCSTMLQLLILDDFSQTIGKKVLLIQLMKQLRCIKEKKRNKD